MATQKMTFDADGGAIYGEPANINYFLKTTLEPDSASGPVDKTSPVKAHTRRKYVGDAAPSNISSTTREYLYDPGRRNGSAIPGNPFILDDGLERRQFHYTGPFVNLHAFFVGDAKMALTLYSQSAAYSIAEAGGEG